MVEVICTIGPSSDSREKLLEMKDNGMTFARINLSHVDLKYVQRVVSLCKELGIEVIIDTEGSQVRTGPLKKDTLSLKEGTLLHIHNKSIHGDEQNLSFSPVETAEMLHVGDLLSVDFDKLLLVVTDIDSLKYGTITAKVINSGVMGKNKSVVVYGVNNQKLELPVLSQKDISVLEYAIKNEIHYVAASFMNSPENVTEVRSLVTDKMKIISKIESCLSLENLSEILKLSDFALIDRGDLSKEIPLERIPLTQKVVLSTGLKLGIPIFIATNLLESMSQNRNPTRAEVNDIVTALLDGASGLVLAGETAIGKYPVECIQVLKKLVLQSTSVSDVGIGKEDLVIKRLEALHYLTGGGKSSLIEPHGGKLINRMLKAPLQKGYTESLLKISANQTIQNELEQIAIGTFSPLEGFMCADDFHCVLENMRLKSGTPWTIPIILDIDEKTKSEIQHAQEVLLTNEIGDPLAIMKVEEVYTYDKERYIQKVYGTCSNEHPGVRIARELKPFFMGGKITLFKRNISPFKSYELTPAQTRKIFEEKGWSKIIGFHSRNIIHRGHEFLQLDALKQYSGDGLFIHPVIGKKKTGDFHPKYIIQSYEIMMEKMYPKGKVFFGVWGTFSRYAGPREAVFTAICRKNFGCSHFIVGGDHTGVGNFYNPTASHEIFDAFPDLGIIPIKYNSICYSKKKKQYFPENVSSTYSDDDSVRVSGTEARSMLLRGESLPEWFMRPEIAAMIITAIKNGEDVFVK